MHIQTLESFANLLVNQWWWCCYLIPMLTLFAPHTAELCPSAGVDTGDGVAVLSPPASRGNLVLDAPPANTTLVLFCGVGSHCQAGMVFRLTRLEESEMDEEAQVRRIGGGPWMDAMHGQPLPGWHGVLICAREESMRQGRKRAEREESIRYVGKHGEESTCQRRKHVQVGWHISCCS